MALHGAITLEVCKSIKNMCQLRWDQLLGLEISSIYSPELDVSNSSAIGEAHPGLNQCLPVCKVNSAPVTSSSLRERGTTIGPRINEAHIEWVSQCQA